MQKIQFDYFTGMEAEQYSFYRVPKVLFTEPCFKALSCEAKVLYGLMLDRMSLSIKNRWLDSEDRVYIIFTVEEIAELMNCGTQKAVKLVKELDSNNGIGLIEKKRLGLGKPNVIYVKNFMIREVPDQKPTDSCADLQSEQKNHGKCADLQSEQGNHEECANLQSEAENREKTGTFLNCENHHSGVVKSTIQDCVESQLQNGENHNSGMMKMENQAVSETQLKNSENHNSEKRNSENPLDYESKCQEFGKNQEKIIEQKDSIASGAQFKNSENQNSRVVKITNQEFSKSQFKNDENHNSEVVKNNILEFSKSQSNKTNINKTDNNQSILSKNVDLSEDEMDKINHCRKIVKEQISYTAFEQNKFYRIKLVDELVELMTEIFMMPDESFERVNGTEKSIAVIKSRFCKINQLHIEYVLDSMQKNQTNIGNIKAYLLTALYNSTITMDSYYQARVNYDLRENF